MRADTNIVLVGMMGSGKSTIGKKLALELSYQFFDTDRIIEDEQGCSISQIFAYAGEELFRKIETEVLSRFLNKKRIILATGGGSIIKAENVKLLKQIGLMCYLNVPIDELVKRVKKGKDRPLLENQDNIAEHLQTLYDQRSQFYGQADFDVKTKDKSQIQVCNEIISYMKSIS